VETPFACGGAINFKLKILYMKDKEAVAIFIKFLKNIRLMKMKKMRSQAIGS
jgi:hypothetical protein